MKKPVKTASGRKSASTNMTSGKKSTPNRPMAEDYQAIIDKIKSRFNDEDLSKMSVTDLQKEIMPQILKLEQKAQEPEPVESEEEEEEEVPASYQYSYEPAEYPTVGEIGARRGYGDYMVS